MFASIAEARSIPGDLRVVDSDGDILAEQTQYTSTKDAKLKSDPKADCFGDGTGGSGDKVTVPGSTALSQLLDAGRSDRDVRPLSISDSFDFGLALCGIGEAVSSQSGFFYLKQNHAGSQTGGDQTTVDAGDDVLWFLVDDFNDPLPDELVLKAPATADAGDDIAVRVTSYDDAGKRTPANNVEVTGAASPTNAKGMTTVPADQDLVTIQATRAGSIPSNVAEVCTLGKVGDCPGGYAETIGGTKGADRIETGKLAETVMAGAGDDKITSTGGRAPDVIKCGGGEDVVKGYGSPKSDEVRFAGCEKVS